MSELNLPLYCLQRNIRGSNFHWRGELELETHKHDLKMNKSFHPRFDPLFLEELMFQQNLGYFVANYIGCVVDIIFWSHQGSWELRIRDEQNNLLFTYPDILMNELRYYLVALYLFNYETDTAEFINDTVRALKEMKLNWDSHWSNIQAAWHYVGVTKNKYDFEKDWLPLTIFWNPEFLAFYIRTKIDAMIEVNEPFDGKEEFIFWRGLISKEELSQEDNLLKKDGFGKYKCLPKEK
jgi:hypothetical protein